MIVAANNYNNRKYKEILVQKYKIKLFDSVIRATTRDAILLNNLIKSFNIISSYKIADDSIIADLIYISFFDNSMEAKALVDFIFFLLEKESPLTHMSFSILKTVFHF